MRSGMRVMLRQIRGQPSRHADLVVVGAGMCGVSFARHAAEAGKRVVLLDSGSIGSGMTGSSAGHVMTGFLPSPAEMISKVGAVETLRLQRWSHESKLALRRRWADLGLGHAITDGYLLVARNREEREVIQGIAAYWREELNIEDVRVTSGQELVDYIRSPTVDSALYDPTSFCIDPPALVEGLRLLVRHREIDVHEETRVVHVASDSGRQRIETTRGTMTAERIVVCTGASVIDFVDGAASPMITKRTRFVVTDPIPREILRLVLPAGLSGSDCSHDPDYWTVLRDGRLMVGCGGGADPPAQPDRGTACDALQVKIRGAASGPCQGQALGTQSAKRVHGPASGGPFEGHSDDDSPAQPDRADATEPGQTKEHLKRLFPSLADHLRGHHLVAEVDTTPSGLPEMREVRPGLVVAHGFSGLGLAAGYGVAGLLALRA